MTIRMKEIEDCEIDEAVSLHNIEYRAHRTSKQWLWEYRSNYPELSVFVIIKDKERIVGTQGIVPIYLNVKGKAYLSGKSENTLVDREYRRRGLQTQLYNFAVSRCKDKGMCCIWGYTSVPNAIRLLRKLGFAVFSNVMRRAILILNVRKFILSILVSKESITRKITNSLLTMPIFLFSRALTHGPKRTSRQFSIEQKLRLGSDVEDLYDRLEERHPNLIHIKQDDKYLSWRVFRNPNFKYATYFMYEQNLLRAYCYISLANPVKVCVSDIVFEDYETGDFLLGTILALLRNRRITSVSFMGNTRNQLMAVVFCLLRKHGFVKIGKGPSFVLNNLCSENQVCRDIENWSLSGLWTEGYTS